MKRIYQNSTSVTLTVQKSDIRNVDRGMVVIGRCPELVSHYEQLADSKFQKPGWLRHTSATFLQVRGNGISVLKIAHRPRGNSSYATSAANRCHTEIEVAIQAVLLQGPIEQLAMAPVSCRRPQAVATGMIRTIWDLSVASFLGSTPMIASRFPNKVSIQSIDDISPFIDVLENGHYPTTRNGWHFNTDIQCNPAKRLRYLRRRKFRFVEVR